jgi:uncharacterized phage protein (TIGR01671 family)
MREIKFRAWDTEKKVMIPAIHIFINWMWVVWENMRDGLEWNDDIRSTKRYELMQYIWIKDKNGKEIYEGDLVKCIAEEKYSKYSWVYPIEYYADEQQFTPKWACNLWWGWWDSIEVVGNVYENPELVTKV